MRSERGLTIEPEQAQRNLERLADLHALFSPSQEVEASTRPPALPRRGGRSEADRREA